MAAIDVISANIPVLRELRGRLGQHELADAVGVSRRTIARIENGEVSDPGVDLTRRIATELGITLTLLTECKLVPVTLALPDDVVARLESADGPETLSAMVRAVRQRG